MFSYYDAKKNIIGSNKLVKTTKFLSNIEMLSSD
jgi:hypothetical protein